jgi:hypothetical protein
VALNNLGLGFVFTARDLASGAIGNLERNFMSLDRRGMVGAPEVPDISNLAGRPLDEVVPPIDAIVKALQDVRGAIPVP